MNLFYYTIKNDDEYNELEYFGWRKCIIPENSKYIVDNPEIKQEYQFLRLYLIIDSIIKFDNKINNILIIGDGYGAPGNNIEHWQYSIDETNTLCLSYKYSPDYRNNFSKLFLPVNVTNIATIGTGFVKETSILHQLKYIQYNTVIHNFYYDAIILIKCNIFNKFINQEFLKLIELTNIAKQCINIY